MKILKLALVPLVLLLAMFCVYGALASLEPSETAGMHVGWFIGYCIVGMGALCFAVWLVWSTWKQDAVARDDWED